MGQTNLKRTQFIPRITVSTPANDDKQFVDFAGYIEIGDIVDFVDVDANGCQIGNPIADNLVVLAVQKQGANPFIVFDQVVDTTVATGTPMFRVQSIDDGQEAIDRLYRRRLTGEVDMEETEAIVAFQQDKPSAGQTTFEVADASLWRIGDVADVLSDEGLVQSNVNVLGAFPNADSSNNKATIVIDASIDLSTFTNPFLLNKTLTVVAGIRRNQERIDEIDRPVENEDMNVLNGEGDGAQTAYETDALFVQGSTKVILDSRRMKLGTAGTRASKIFGTGDAQLTAISNILGTLGNEVELQVVDAAGLTVAVTKVFKVTANGTDFSQSQYLVQVNNNSGAATAKEIAEAVNADADAKRIMQLKWGGDGSGTVAAIAATNLENGADDGTGDYAELEQIREVNDGSSIENSTTGFKWISFHIRPNERNRLSEPPSVDEEICVDYRIATENVDR